MKIDWPALMALGLVRLRLSPEQFWALTPAELMFLAHEGQTGRGALSRSGLDALMAAYPDHSNGEDRDE